MMRRVFAAAGMVGVWIRPAWTQWKRVLPTVFESIRLFQLRVHGAGDASLVTFKPEPCRNGCPAKIEGEEMKRKGCAGRGR